MKIRNSFINRKLSCRTINTIWDNEDEFVLKVRLMASLNLELVNMYRPVLLIRKVMKNCEKSLFVLKFMSLEIPRFKKYPRLHDWFQKNSEFWNGSNMFTLNREFN